MDVFLVIIYCWIGLAIILFPVQFIATAPYGRHSTLKLGATMGNKMGWFVMEIVSPIVFGYFFLNGGNEITTPMWIFFLVWIGHYINRSIIYPLRTKTSEKRIPLLIVGSAIFFNTVNGWINGYMLGSFMPSYPTSWIQSPQFFLGVMIFLVGAYINISSDNHLISLRAGEERGYKIPVGGLFRKVSCPNHLGEIIEWTGFAIMCWNPAAFSFAIWTAANLIPRALSHHKWYKTTFTGYPTQRKAVIPYLL